VSEKAQYKGDKWTVINGAEIPQGAAVDIVRFYPRRRVLVRWEGRLYLTLRWCIERAGERQRRG